MKKEFITYEIALRLKELGFDEECFMIFRDGTLKAPALTDWYNHNCRIGNTISAPLWQQVIDWFREKHNIHIEILSFDTETILYDPIVKQLINGEWSDEYPEYDSQDNYYTARELAIQKAIEILFEN